MASGVIQLFGHNTPTVQTVQRSRNIGRTVTCSHCPETVKLINIEHPKKNTATCIVYSLLITSCTVDARPHCATVCEPSTSMAQKLVGGLDYCSDIQHYHCMSWDFQERQVGMVLRIQNFGYVPTTVDKLTHLFAI